jgi:hypothetical protein
MAIDLLALEPHKVSKDLSGYITYVYGAPKTGKTTLATQMGDAILLAFEQGYNALPGVIAQDILTWGDMRQTYNQLRKPEVKARFKAVIVDTIDVAADKCKKYICQQNDIEDLGDLGYGKGWTKFKDEFNEIFRGLTQLGYAVFFIGHHKEQPLNTSDGKERIIVRPNLSNSTRETIAGMADIYGYAHQLRADEMSVLTLRDPSGSIECGCRFKYIPHEITLSYDNLVNAITNAIDKEAAEHDGKYVTEERAKVVEAPTYNYAALMDEFQTIVGQLMSTNPANGAKITAIVEKYLGKGKKVSDTTETQVEFVHLIIEDIKEELLK